MRKLLNNPYVSGALALVAVALVASSLLSGNGHRPRYLASESDDASYDEQPVEPGLAQPASAFDPAAIVALAAAAPARNLFARPIIASASSSESDAVDLASATVRVKGVWIQGNARYVIIDDRMLEPGQSLERVRVERIEPQGVWLAYNQESHFVQPGQSWTYQYPRPKDNSRN